jgi:hypothetical protein
MEAVPRPQKSGKNAILRVKQPESKQVLTRFLRITYERIQLPLIMLSYFGQDLSCPDAMAWFGGR